MLKRNNDLLNDMRKTSVVTSLFIVFIIIAAPALATRGIGIKYGLEYTKFYAGQENCLDYKVYNPWDEDVTIGLTVGGDLEQIFKSSEKADVPAGTSSSDAMPLEICFDTPALDKDNCEETVYKGEVIARETTPDGVSGTGSATSVIASAPLTVELICDELITGAPVLEEKKAVKIHFGKIFYILGIAVSLAVLMVLATRYRNNPERRRRKYMKIYNEVTQLQQDLQEDPFDQGKRFKYNELSGKLEKMYRDF